MSAAILASSQEAGSLRPVNLRNDLAGISDLIEICFSDTMDDAGRAALREMRMVSQSPSLSLLFHGVDKLMGGLEQGFVWIDKGQIIGNITVTPSAVGFVISNVAVHPDYRRRGIALSLMTAALDLIRQRHGHVALLQVHAGNEPAERLYRQLGFRAERAFTRWRRLHYFHPPERLPNMPFMTLLPARDWRTDYQLAELVRPNEQGGLGWLRPTTEETFSPSIFRAIGSWLIGNQQEHWITRDEHGRGITADLWVTMGLMGPDKFDLMVHPAWQGRMEEPLLNYVLRRLEPRRRTLVTEHPADDAVANALFERYRFERGHTTINMRLNLQ